MATPSPPLTRPLQALATDLGAQIKAQRKKLKVTAVAAAESAGMSRVTWHRIEKGSVSVTLGSYMLAAHVVGLAVSLKPAGVEKQEDQALTPGEIELIDALRLALGRNMNVSAHRMG